VKVTKEEYESLDKHFVHITNLKNDLIGTVQKSSLRSSIKVNLKTLYGDRLLHTFEVKISDRLCVLVDRLLEEEKTKVEKDEKKQWDKNYQYRIISPIGSIKELLVNKTFIDQNIKDGQTMILASPEKIYFSETMHGSGIVIENNNSCAYKQTGEEHQYALLNKGFNSGRCYFEFILETEPDEQNIILGVTTGRSDYHYTTECKNFWGYVPSL
jgi:hypothetical protein